MVTVQLGEQFPSHDAGGVLVSAGKDRRTRSLSTLLFEVGLHHLSLPGHHSYTFDIYISEAEDADNFDWNYPIDFHEMKTPYLLGIPETYTAGDPPEEKPGHQLQYRTDGFDNTVAVGAYYLRDTYGLDAQSAEVHFVDPALATRARALGPGAENETPYEVDLYTFGTSDSSGPWRAVFLAQDDHAPSCRDHASNRMLALNQADPVPAAANFDQSPKSFKLSTTAADCQRRLKDHNLEACRPCQSWHWYDNSPNAPEGSRWHREDNDPRVTMAMDGMTTTTASTPHRDGEARRPIVREMWGSLLRSAVWCVNTEGKPQGFGLWCGQDGGPNSSYGIFADDQHNQDLKDKGYTDGFFVSRLPADALSHVHCALILCCHDIGSTDSAITTAIRGKGAKWVGAVVGGKLMPDDCKKLYHYFWHWASGNPLMPGGPVVVKSMKDSLADAVEASRPFALVGNGQGPFRDFSLPPDSALFLGPVGGGKTEAELREMGPLDDPVPVDGTAG